MTTRDEAFDHWWYHEGSQGPTAGNDLEEHCKRMCEIAWQNGAYKALEQAEQHPVAWVYPEFSEHLKRAGCWTAYANNGTGPYADGVKRIPVYFEPPQRKPLTDEQTIILKNTTCPEIDWKARHFVEMNNGERNKWMLEWFMAFKVAIEAAHGIEENT